MVDETKESTSEVFDRHGAGHGHAAAGLRDKVNAYYLESKNTSQFDF
jgi:hypothetical protein